MHHPVTYDTLTETKTFLKILNSIAVFKKDFYGRHSDKAELWIHCSLFISQGQGGKDDGKSSGE